MYKLAQDSVHRIFSYLKDYKRIEGEEDAKIELSSSFLSKALVKGKSASIKIMVNEERTKNKFHTSTIFDQPKEIKTIHDMNDSGITEKCCY